MNIYIHCYTFFYQYRFRDIMRTLVKCNMSEQTVDEKKINEYKRYFYYLLKNVERYSHAYFTRCE